MSGQKVVVRIPAHLITQSGRMVAMSGTREHRKDEFLYVSVIRKYLGQRMWITLPVKGEAREYSHSRLKHRCSEAGLAFSNRGDLREPRFKLGHECGQVQVQRDQPMSKLDEVDSPNACFDLGNIALEHLGPLGEFRLRQTPRHSEFF